jgi:hypothetical protein
LHAGDKVQFELGRDKRPRATNVRVRRAAHIGNGTAAERDRVWRPDGVI